MAISEKILKAPPSTGFTDDPRDHFGTAYWEGNGTSQSVNGGKFDACADFVHASAHFDIVSPISIASNTDFTYSFWLNFPTVPGTSGFLFGLFGGTVNGTYGPMNLNFYGNADGTAHSVERYFNSTQHYSDNYSTEAKFTYSANTWYHVALVYTGSSTSAQVYHNGSATGSSYVLDTTYGSQTLSNSHCVGMYNPGYYTGSYGFWGKMDHFRIYDSALSSTEVTALYNESYDDSFKLNFPSGKTAKSLYRFNGDITDTGGTYDGTGSTSMDFTKSVNFTPDVVWVKPRSHSGHHSLFDTIRGVSKVLTPNQNGAEIDRTSNSAGVTAFSSGGFTVNDPGGSSENYYVNQDNVTYAAWCWNAGGSSATNNTGSIQSTVRANTTSGFSVVKYTGNGTAGATIGHGLSSAPELILLKNLNVSDNWAVYNSASGATKYMNLNQTYAAGTASTLWNDTSPTSSVFSVGTSTDVNGSGNALIAYCFTSITGYQKIGSYTGNGNANGTMVETGFEPAFVMIKGLASSRSWTIYDNQRSISNPRQKILHPHSDAAENDHSDNAIDFYSDGFQLITNWDGVNGSSETYLYLAIAAPLETTTPALAKSFKVSTYTGDKPNDKIISDVGFSPSFVWIKNRDSVDSNAMFDTIRGEYALESDSQNSQSDFQGYFSFNHDGFTVGNSGQINESSDDFVAWSWKASDSTEMLPKASSSAGQVNSIASINDEAGFSIVKWYAEGNSVNSGVMTTPHGLSAAPGLIISRDINNGDNWWVYHSSKSSANSWGYFNLDNAWGSGTYGYTNVNSTSFTSYITNNATNIISYCWRPITGYSSFGSYTATGSAGSPTITTGFQPDWVMVKNADRAQEWVIIDSVRGLGNSLRPDSDAAEYTGNSITVNSTSFTINASGGGVNYASGDTFVYAAFKMN